MKCKRTAVGMAFGAIAASVFVISLAAMRPDGAPAVTGPATIQLQPVVSGGLTQPVLLTNARDGSGRLFIVELPGRIRLLPPGSTTATVFLDISAKVLSGGERGLLGLAFHPQYASNGRFFVDYTRQPDGATVIAEYQTDANSPDLADPSESILMIIPQPFANHNGGMVEFGPDGFLYIGMGDGGSGNDPDNRAQNPQELLGKILRIDVDRAAPGLPYAIPPSNPFSGSSAGRPEIYATGLRNPWRFSFDRATGRLYSGDVGQNAVEEIDIIRLGGNYGWRVLEGTSCTNLGPASCASTAFIPPVAEYTHELGRCSVTGGYVYRGRRTSLPQGAYVYADFCSGEIFMRNAGTHSVLLDTSINISSFGEDEDGEIYVVGLGGTVDRIVNPLAPSQAISFFPRLASTGLVTAAEEEFTGLAVANLDGDAASLTFTAFNENGTLLQGADVSNPKTLTLQAGEQLARVDLEIFGAGLRTLDRRGWVRMESSTAKMGALFMAFDGSVRSLDGTLAEPILLSEFILPDINPSDAWKVFLLNPHGEPNSVDLDLCANDGATRATVSLSLAPNQVFAQTPAALFPGLIVSATDYLRGKAPRGIALLEFLKKAGQDSRALNAMDATAGNTILYAPQYVVGGGFRSTLTVANLESASGSVSFRFFDDGGNPMGAAQILPIAGRGKILLSDATFFGNFGSSLTQGYVEVRSDGPLLAGCISYSSSDGRPFATGLPLVAVLEKRVVFAHFISNADYYTGIAVVNPSSGPANVRIEVHDQLGQLKSSGSMALLPAGRIASTLTSLLPSLAGQNLAGGYVLVKADRAAASIALFGTYDLAVLAALPAQTRLVQ